MKTSEVTACVVDHGIFLPVARRLAREFKKVYYYTPHEKAFPTVRDIIGDGFEEIERVESPFSVAPDVYVFPDIGFSELQKSLSGFIPVWGVRDADQLEIKRGKFLSALKQTDLPVPEYHECRGLSELKEYLKDKSDKWVKISRFRGDWETLHWRDWAQDESTLDAAALRFGPWKDHLTFYVFDPIETEIEDGYDGWCIDGKWPTMSVRGMEAKDRAYLGTFTKYTDLPEPVRKVNEAFGPILAQYGYRSFFSSEVRITEDGKGYFLDPTCRAGSPPSQVMCEMIGNLGDIIWRGAQGECVDPEPVAQFGVQGLLTVKGDRRNQWAVFELPDDLDQWVKCGFANRIDGRIVVPPDPENHSSDIGWVVAIGDSIEEAIGSLKDKVSKLPDGLCCDYTALADLLKEAKEAEKQDVPLTDEPIPPPESVISDD